MDLKGAYVCIPLSPPHVKFKVSNRVVTEYSEHCGVLWLCHLLTITPGQSATRPQSADTGLATGGGLGRSSEFRAQRLHLHFVGGFCRQRRWVRVIKNVMPRATELKVRNGCRRVERCKTGYILSGWVLTALD